MPRKPPTNNRPNKSKRVVETHTPPTDDSPLVTVPTIVEVHRGRVEFANAPPPMAKLTTDDDDSEQWELGLTTESALYIHAPGRGYAVLTLQAFAEAIGPTLRALPKEG